jgi:hypothetical protein
MNLAKVSDHQVSPDCCDEDFAAATESGDLMPESCVSSIYTESMSPGAFKISQAAASSSRAWSGWSCNACVCCRRILVTGFGENDVTLRANVSKKVTRRPLEIIVIVCENLRYEWYQQVRRFVLYCISITTSWI